MPILTDNFTGTAATLLTAHTADSGHAWVDVTAGPFGPGNILLDGSGMIYAGSGAYVTKISDAVIADDCQVESVVYRYTDAGAGSLVGIVLRADAVGNGYFLGNFLGNWAISKTDSPGGIGTSTAVTLSVAGSVTIRAEAEGTELRLYVDNALVAVATNSSHTSGSVGVLSGNGSGAGDTLTSITAAALGASDLTGADADDWFVCYGQSNFAGSATNQTFVHPSLSAYKANAAGAVSLLVDPTFASSAATGSTGSSIPVIMSRYAARRNRKPGVLNMAVGGQTIAQLSKGNGSGRYTEMLASALALVANGGVLRAMLWWQGEADAGSTSTATYRAALIQLGADVFADLGIPVIAALLQNSTGIPDADAQTIRDAVTQAVAASAHVLLGPDLSVYTTNDSYHLQSAANLSAAATRWDCALERHDTYSDGAGGVASASGGTHLGAEGLQT